MRPTDHRLILESLGFRSARKLGAGINSTVYRLDEDRIIKIGSFNESEITRLKDLLDALGGSDLPFRIPRIFESGEVAGQSYTIERLIPGAALRHVFPTLSAAKQEGCIHGVARG